jgi:hypothetical protein
MFRNKTIKFVIIGMIIVISFIAGYSAARVVHKFEIDSLAKQIRADVEREIEARLSQIGIAFPAPEKVFMLERAVIENIDLNVSKPYIIVRPSVIQDPLGKLFPPQIKVFLTPETELTKIVKHKDPETGKIISTFISGSLKDFQIGDKVNVISEEDVIGKSEIIAKEVIEMRVPEILAE